MAEKGRRVYSTANGLNARTSPNGAIAKNKGKNLVRPKGFTFVVTDRKSAGGRWWNKATTYWYAEQYLSEKKTNVPSIYDAPRKGGKGADYAAKQVGKSCKVGWCQATVNSWYGVGPSGGSATAAFQTAKQRVTTGNSNAIPRGAKVHWSGGSKGYGHVAIGVGNGKCISTDWPRGRTIGVARIDDISRKWGLRLQGYVRVDANNKRVY